MQKSRLNQVFVGLYLLSTLISPLAAFSREIELRGDYKLRTLDSGQMERAGLLKKGTRVQIPDQYVQNNSKGQPDFELTVNYWLRQGDLGSSRSGSNQFKQRFDGDQTDYFFPVTIAKKEDLAPGSTYPDALFSDTKPEIFLGLRTIARNGDALFTTKDLQLVALKDLLAPKKATEPPTVQPQPVPTPSPGSQVEADGQTEAQGVATCLGCRTGAARDALADDLAPAFKAVEEGMVGRRNRVIAPGVEQNLARFRASGGDIEAKFKSTCGGKDINQFRKMLSAMTSHDRELREVMTSIMNLESQGSCLARASEHDRSASVGLFQVNSDSAKGIPRCNKEQLGALNDRSLTELQKSPECLENPMINAREAIRIFKEKDKAIFEQGLQFYNKATKQKVNFEPFDRNSMNRADQIRLSLAAYNGGELWVFKAKASLEKFNTQNPGANLNPNSWEDLRLFMLRSFLNGPQQKEHFGNVAEGRSPKKIVTNLAYVETLIPRYNDSLRTVGGSYMAISE